MMNNKVSLKGQWRYDIIPGRRLLWTKQTWARTWSGTWTRGRVLMSISDLKISLSFFSIDNNEWRLNLKQKLSQAQSSQAIRFSQEKKFNLFHVDKNIPRCTRDALQVAMIALQVNHALAFLLVVSRQCITWSHHVTFCFTSKHIKAVFLYFYAVLYFTLWSDCHVWCDGHLGSRGGKHTGHCW